LYSYQVFGDLSDKAIDNIPVIRYNFTMVGIYSVSEAAQKLGLDPSQVRRLLKDGKIEGTKLGHDWVVLSLNYKKKKFGVGRKPKRSKK